MSETARDWLIVGILFAVTVGLIIGGRLFA